ncbi:transposase [Undibacterium sp. CY7W]|uniref:Transposase n=1 Tax=Undibacterium rugosum TaxID=2762291 RepID=A0A923I5T7_9BURK|nr:transposase [Undibacterium rugosum]
MRISMRREPKTRRSPSDRTLAWRTDEQDSCSGRTFFNRIKQFRRIATRYEKLGRNYLSFLNLVCTYVWIA